MDSHSVAIPKKKVESVSQPRELHDDDEKLHVYEMMIVVVVK